MAEVILRSAIADAGLSSQVTVDSAGTGDWHIGEQADRRALDVLSESGYAGDSHRARQFDAGWFAERDLILAADLGHYRRLRALAPDADAQGAIRMLRDFDPAAVADGTLELDDPWFGDQAGFVRCREEIEAAVPGILAHVREGLRAG